jgi:hypothetical protein
MVGVEEKIVLDRIVKRRDLGRSLVAQGGVSRSFRAIINFINSLNDKEF